MGFTYPCALLCVVLLIVAGCGGGSSTPPTPISVTVSPATARVTAGGTQQFTAAVSGTSNTAVTWSVAGGAANGTISAAGLYTAPATAPTPSQVTVTATAQADSTKSGTATVTVVPPIGTVAVIPNSASLLPFTTQNFSVQTTNLSSSAVTWQVNGVTGGSQATGFISNGANPGLYVAPGGVPTIAMSGQSNPTTVTVTAVSQVNPSLSGSATVTITNGLAQNSTTFFGSSGGNQKDSMTSGMTTTCCSGTLGSLVTRGGAQYILSNNHVLAREDLGTPTNGTTPGDNVIQPGLSDINCGSGPFTIVANLAQFYNLETGPGAKIDAAIAQLTQTGAMDAQGRILYLGATTDSNNVPVPGAPHGGSGLAETGALVGRAVAKSGRTTGLTCSSVLSVSTTINVSYPKGCNANTEFSVQYVNQITLAGGKFSASGDSGSLVVTQDTADPVGLLYAGSDQDTTANPVADVLNYFQSGSNSMTFVGGATHAVIGCTLPTAPASVVAAVPLAAVPKEALQKAVAVRAVHESELLGYPAVQALGLGASQDRAGEAAIVFFMSKGAGRKEIPQEVDGVRTRIIEGEEFGKRGVLTAEQSEELEQAAAKTAGGLTISDAEFLRAKTVHGARGEEWMSKAGVQGVGIGASGDSPGEAALMIFLIRGVAHDTIPAVIDGVRTRVRESSPFVAGLDQVHSRGGCSARGGVKK